MGRACRARTRRRRNGGCTGAWRPQDRRTALPPASLPPPAVPRHLARPVRPRPTQLIGPGRPRTSAHGAQDRLHPAHVRVPGLFERALLVWTRAPQPGCANAPWLDPLGAGTPAWWLCTVLTAMRGPACPAASLRPRFRALPGAGVDELTDCLGPTSLARRVRRVAITLAFDQPAAPLGVENDRGVDTDATGAVGRAWTSDYALGSADYIICIVTKRRNYRGNPSISTGRARKPNRRASTECSAHCLRSLRCGDSVNALA